MGLACCCCCCSAAAQGLMSVLGEEPRRCASLLAKGLAKGSTARDGCAKGLKDGGTSAALWGRGGVIGALTCSALVLWLLHVWQRKRLPQNGHASCVTWVDHQEIRKNNK